MLASDCLQSTYSLARSAYTPQSFTMLLLCCVPLGVGMGMVTAEFFTFRGLRGWMLVACPPEKRHPPPF